jgi:hypothetical protein
VNLAVTPAVVGDAAAKPLSKFCRRYVSVLQLVELEDAAVAGCVDAGSGVQDETVNGGAPG